jgi:galactokinase
MNQQYLQEFGVSGEKIDEVIEIMMMNNVHGKLTGGGGDGGCVIGFFVP